MLDHRCRVYRGLLLDDRELERAGFALREVEGRLSLVDLEDPRVLPVAVDFASGAILHRLRQGSGKSQPLAKALGVRPGNFPTVFDLTAGLGVDAFFMAALGCRVRGCERSPVIAALLADGYRRLAASEDSRLQEIASRLCFEQGAASAVLSRLSEGEWPDVIYLDPMYPEDGRSRSALPKKGMQFFRRLLGDDLDARELLEPALRAARERVVVKRPLHAPALGGRPTHVFESKTARFDMYLAPSGARG